MTSICLTQSLPGAIKIEGTYLGYSMSKENSHFRALLKDLEAQDIQLKEVEDRQQGIDGVAKGELAGYIEWSTNNYALYLPGGK